MKAKVLMLVAAPVLIAFGWNNLDAMMNTFYWLPWRNWHESSWFLTPFLKIDWWLAYFFCGVLPLALGWFLVGWLCSELYRWEVRS